MLLGKRPRPPIKRTTSLTEFSIDVSSITKDDQTAVVGGVVADPSLFDPNYPFKGLDQGYMAAAGSPLSPMSPSPRPRNLRRSSADFNATGESSAFLRACALCKRRLIPGRDIYMYRGDSAFCSLECRQEQMNRDERKEKCSLDMASSAGSEVVSTQGETVAAVM